MSQVDLEDDAFERIAARQAKLELKRSNAKLAAEKALLEMDVKAAEHFQAQIIREIKFKRKLNIITVLALMFLVAQAVFTIFYS